MINQNLGWRLIGIVLSVLLLAGCNASTSTPEPPDKILFVGDSVTYWNKGLDLHFKELAASAAPPLAIETDAVTNSVSALRWMWEFSEARDLIAKGAYDVVVLQEDLDITTVDTFFEYARKFGADIKEAGAEPVLFMSWQQEDPPVTIEEIAQAHRDIAAELDVAVAPVGLAVERVKEERPDLDMYDFDRIHPSLHATYLAVNVVYATVLGESPIGLTYLPPAIGRTSVTEEEAAFLQRIAWETVQEYQAQQ